MYDIHNKNNTYLMIHKESCSVNRKLKGVFSMESKDLMQRILLLEFHQKLLLTIIKNKDAAFYELVVEKNISEKEMKHILKVCELTNMQYKKQKAEGFVYFHPLLQQFTEQIPSKLKAEEVIEACIRQKLYVPLMSELKKYST